MRTNFVRIFSRKLLTACFVSINLEFYSEQPQELYDRLPEHWTVQDLSIRRAPPEFLFRIRQSLVHLKIDKSIDVKLV